MNSPFPTHFPPSFSVNPRAEVGRRQEAKRKAGLKRRIVITSRLMQYGTFLFRTPHRPSPDDGVSPTKALAIFFLTRDKNRNFPRNCLWLLHP